MKTIENDTCVHVGPKANGDIFKHGQWIEKRDGRAKTRANGDGADAGIVWAYFIGATDTEILAWCRSQNWGCAYRAPLSAYDCTGRESRSGPIITRVGSRAIVKNHWSVDV